MRNGKGPSGRPFALIRAAGLGVAAFVSASFLSGCYVTEQGFRYLSLRSGARPLESVLADPAISPELRLLADRALRVRAFAVGELGLAETRNYRSLVSLDSDRLATVVQACAELSFERYLWSYPVVGRLPYKGFFDPAEAEREAAVRRAEGLDTIVRPVDAFSTLGWFADPLFSFMKDYGEADLAELVIHELCHATAFAKGAADWNEELATFVGREGAARYLAASGADSSRPIAEAELARRDAEAFAAYLKGTAELLEPLYSGPSSDAEKRSGKARIIAARADEFEANYDEYFATERYRGFPMAGINNAWLDLYRLYEGESGLYRDYLDRVSRGDLRRFVADMARLAKGRVGTGDPKAAMRKAIAEAAGASLP